MDGSVSAHNPLGYPAEGNRLVFHDATRSSVASKECMAKIFMTTQSIQSQPGTVSEMRQTASGRGTMAKETGIHPANHSGQGKPAQNICPEWVGANHIFRLIAYHKLRSITELSGKAFLRAWWHIVSCHYELWKQDIHHRDISESNLMYYCNAEGVAVGVLNDFDLSSTTKGRQSNKRTGTIAFMAIELLTQTVLDGHETHEYHHAAESFIWVLAWVTLHYEHGTRLPRQHRPLERLLSSQGVACGKEKVWLMVSERNELKPPPSQQESWKVAMGCLEVLAMQYAETGAGVEDVLWPIALFSKFPSAYYSDLDFCPAIRPPKGYNIISRAPRPPSMIRLRSMRDPSAQQDMTSHCEGFVRTNR
ncbi:hypothetical protein BV22DRAFT_1121048 [Leucogyrophana mollusca]|uniref:Uncharacterized protein n=1 Tax=Leucogyrophana mollusca TaxID=85980 RepID=A0ACB8BBN7_9AGAM|nr:hypothetical protein BV22DRAFT_1121048 [Leucogyrophana mollusca]